MISGIGVVFALIEILYILMIVLGANQANAFFKFVQSLAEPLALFFPGLFATGNYNFFNVLTMLVCVALLDDRRLRGARTPGVEPALSRVVPRVVLGAFALMNALQLHVVFGRVSTPEAIVLGVVEPWQIVNRYGLFAVMTQERRELVIEWSRDGDGWREVEFPFKPGALDAAPRWATPHQPRLDWQMWFAALGTCDTNPWLVRAMERLAEGSPAVTGLLAEDPFAGAPPRYVRAVLYDYRFTDAAERGRTGDWWRREWKGPYCPVVARDEAAPGLSPRSD